IERLKEETARRRREREEKLRLSAALKPTVPASPSPSSAPPVYKNPNLNVRDFESRVLNKMMEREKLDEMSRREAS
ncbi:13062_t:CDS:2, partial [Acaulospora colombiana]